MSMSKFIFGFILAIVMGVAFTTQTTASEYEVLIISIISWILFNQLLDILYGDTDNREGAN